MRKTREAIEMDTASPSAGNGPARTRVLGYPVDAVSRKMAVDLVIARSQAGHNGSFVCLTNVHTTVESQHDSELKEACEAAFLSVPDGMPLVWILHRRGFRHVEKVTGIEYIPQVAEIGRASGLRHFFLGGAPGVATAAAEKLCDLVPGIQVVGSFSPPYGPPESWDLEPLREQLREQRPHIVWVGLGAPKQERWMAAVSATLQVPMMVGVGAAFDFLAGTKRPAPRFMSRMGLEWLFRLVAEPRRLWHRYVIGNSRFVWLLTTDALARWKRRLGRRGD